MSESDAGLPSNPEELEQIPVELPRLDRDSPESCPASMNDILEYLRSEAYPDAPSASALEFLRTASVDGAEYWIWRFLDSDGNECYVTVSRRDEQVTLGYEQNYDGLTPEQFMLAESRGWI